MVRNRDRKRAVWGAGGCVMGMGDGRKATYQWLSPKNKDEYRRMSSQVSTWEGQTQDRVRFEERVNCSKSYYN